MKIETLHSHFLNTSGVCTDTRKIHKDCFFVALKGENFNANTFTDEALKLGASKVLIDDMRYHRNTGETIYTGNALKTLQKLASYHRSYLGIPIIALTGSNGKTTTKELINAVLSKKYYTTATKGNLNNHIGVPLTLLTMTKETEIGIVEMGANHLKEIAQLSEIAQPTYGYITNFGKAHLEGFGSVEGVIKGKSELYKYLITHKKSIFFNADDEKQRSILSNYVSKYGYSQTDENFFKITQVPSQQFISASFDGITVNTNLIGDYNFANVSAAIIMGKYFNVPKEAIKEGLENYIPTNNRSQIIKKEEHHIILDAYNANPTSMLAALASFKKTEASHKVLFLGDMFELGVDAEKEHQAIADYIVAEEIGNTVYLVGENFNKVKVNSTKITKCKKFEDVKNILNKQKPSPSSILIKGSRGMALERVLELL